VANAAVGRRWAGHAIGILAGVSAGVTFLFGAFDLASAGTVSTGSGGQNSAELDIGIMVTSVVAATLAAKPVRDRVARVLPLDPDSPVHAIALVLAVILFGIQLSSFLFADVFASVGTLPPLTLGDIIAQEVPFLILAGAGVGLFMRRNTSQAMDRLGLTVPRWWHVALALAAAGVFFGFQLVMDGLSHSLTPQVAHQVDNTTQRLFGGLDNPAGILALALAPGICEEVLFRGALQPRLGLIVTALLFASIHTQYGFSIDALAVFVIALGLGLIRKYTNTTTSSLCHVTYNLLVGVGIGSQILGPAVTVELVLLGLVLYALWAGRRRAPVEANP
jgi:membrane protease YdiL (CAAX protease family)